MSVCMPKGERARVGVHGRTWVYILYKEQEENEVMPVRNEMIAR